MNTVMMTLEMKTKRRGPRILKLNKKITKRMFITLLYYFNLILILIAEFPILTVYPII